MGSLRGHSLLPQHLAGEHSDSHFSCSPLRKFLQLSRIMGNIIIGTYGNWEKSGLDPKEERKKEKKISILTDTVKKSVFPVDSQISRLKKLSAVIKSVTLSCSTLGVDPWPHGITGKTGSSQMFEDETSAVAT